MSDTLTILGWDALVQRLAALADTEMGRSELSRTRPQPDRRWLEDEHNIIRECLRWLDSGRPTALGASPLVPLLDRAKKGGSLVPQEFLAISRTVEVYRQWGEAADPALFPLVAERVRSFPWPRALLESIEQTLDADGLVRDTASPALADIRRRMRQMEREIDQVFERVLHSGDWSQYLQDRLVTLRFGRRVVPIKNEFRNRVSGIVHDESGSGQTVFVEPLAVVERQNRLTSLHQDEAREVERILALLTGQVVQNGDTLTRVHEHLTWFDSHIGRARHGLSMAGVLPAIGGGTLNLTQARHPLLPNPVPISLQLSLDHPAIIITGPNTGGKTVALKTTGLLVSMGLAGLMVPAEEGTTIPLYQDVMADIGDEQSLEQNLSTFSSHLARLAPMMRRAGPETLCLIDEIGAGTDPEEGAALAEVMVRHLVERHAALIASTHFQRLKLLALGDPRINNALVEFNRETLSPTYHLIMGSPGSSHAFYIARRLGFPEELVDRAEALMDEEAMSLADAIQAVNRLQRELREKEAYLRDEQTELARLRQELEAGQAQLRERGERDREKALKSWRREWEDVQAKFDQALAAVRVAEGQERSRAVEALRTQYRGLAKVPAYLARAPKAGTPPEAVGERVRVAGFPDVGVVTELTGRTATVEIGSLRMKLSLDELERAGEAPPPAPKPAARRRAGSDLGREKSQSLGIEVDLRGMTQQEALEVLDKYLDDAVLAGAPFARIIHGKGTGALRRAVSNYLKSDSRVYRYRLGDAGEGGDGVTVAALEEQD